MRYLLALALVGVLAAPAYAGAKLPTMGFGNGGRATVEFASRQVVDDKRKIVTDNIGPVKGSEIRTVGRTIQLRMKINADVLTYSRVVVKHRDFRVQPEPQFVEKGETVLRAEWVDYFPADGSWRHLWGASREAKMRGVTVSVVPWKRPVKINKRGALKSPQPQSQENPRAFDPLRPALKTDGSRRFPGVDPAERKVPGPTTPAELLEEAAKRAAERKAQEELDEVARQIRERLK